MSELNNLMFNFEHVEISEPLSPVSILFYPVINPV